MSNYQERQGEATNEVVIIYDERFDRWHRWATKRQAVYERMGYIARVWKLTNWQAMMDARHNVGSILQTAAREDSEAFAVV